MLSWHMIKTQLMSRPFLWLIFIFNLFGSIYGFYWYGNQLAATGWYWNFFVPDSPTSSSLFTLVILLYLLRRQSPLLEMLSMVTNIKYGIWACGVIVTYWMAGDEVDAIDLMLLISHGAMAIEVILYNFSYRFDWRLLWVGAVWLMFNDFVDYVFDIHPWLQDDTLVQPIALATVLLSVFTIALTAALRPRELREIDDLRQR